MGSRLWHRSCGIEVVGSRLWDRGCGIEGVGSRRGGARCRRKGAEGDYAKAERLLAHGGGECPLRLDAHQIYGCALAAARLAMRGNAWQCVAMRGNQSQSVAISRNQPQPVAAVERSR